MLNNLLPRMLLLFWFIWFLIASFSNLFDLLVGIKFLSEQWVFRSGNLLDIIHVVSIYGIPYFIAQWLFVGIIIIEFTSALLFLVALISHIRNSKKLYNFVTTAFITSIMLWMLFLIVSELFVFYAYSSKHLMLLVAELISLWIVIYFSNIKGAAYEVDIQNNNI